MMIKNGLSRLLFILLLAQSITVWAEDPFVEKQRQIQQEMFRRFTALDRRINGEEKPKTEAKPEMFSSHEPVTFIDSIAYPYGIRDPFAIPSLLLQTLAIEHNNKMQGNMTSSYSSVKTSLLTMPKIKLKGVMHQRRNLSPLAVILLNNEIYMVREGDEIGFNLAEPSQVIKIKKIKRLSLLIEVRTLGQLVIVR
ncbi:MAG: hypothetical protein GQ532_19335 [Methylomarinum sp.]|nr:hypothetical protein [Methylomarinum sp.]